MTGFKPRICGVVSVHSTNCATTTTKLLTLYDGKLRLGSHSTINPAFMILRQWQKSLI